jgi:hypothetical protein
MSHLRTGIWTAIAVSATLSATLGAAQFAFGHDLASGLRAFSAEPQQGVNRAAKADRFAGLAVLSAPTQTISIHVDRVADTSVLVRIPRPPQAGNAAPAPMPIKSEEQKAKATVACEPVVSVLTDIAKRLQPGRCMT